MIWNSFGNTCDIVPLLFKHNAIISTNLCHYKYDIVPLVTSFTYRVVYGGTWRHCDVIVTSLMSSSVVRQSLLPWPLMGEDVHVVCIHSRKCDNVYTRHRIHWWKRCRTKCDNVSTRVAHSWPKFTKVWQEKIKCLETFGFFVFFFCWIPTPQVLTN